MSSSVLQNHLKTIPKSRFPGSAPWRIQFSRLHWDPSLCIFKIQVILMPLVHEAHVRNIIF